MSQPSSPLPSSFQNPGTRKMLAAFLAGVLITVLVFRLLPGLNPSGTVPLDPTTEVPSMHRVAKENQMSEENRPNSLAKGIPHPGTLLPLGERLAKLNPAKYETLQVDGTVTEELAHALELTIEERTKVELCFADFRKATLAVQAAHVKLIESNETMQKFQISPFAAELTEPTSRLQSALALVLPPEKTGFLQGCFEKYAAPFLASSGTNTTELEFQTTESGLINYKRLVFGINSQGDRFPLSTYGTSFEKLPEHLALIFKLQDP